MHYIYIQEIPVRCRTYCRVREQPLKTVDMHGRHGTHSCETRDSCFGVEGEGERTPFFCLSLASLSRLLLPFPHPVRTFSPLPSSPASFSLLSFPFPSLPFPSRQPTHSTYVRPSRGSTARHRLSPAALYQDHQCSAVQLNAMQCTLSNIGLRCRVLQSYINPSCVIPYPISHIPTRTTLP